MPKASLKDFTRAFGGNVLTAMSGSLSVPFAAAALIFPQTWAKTLFAAMTAVCVVVSAFRIWENERTALIDAEQTITNLKRELTEERGKRPAPEVIVEMEWEPDLRPTTPGFVTTNRRAFSLRNCGNADARDVQVQEIHGESKIASFEVIARIGSGETASVNPRIEAMDCAPAVSGGHSRDFEYFVKTDLCRTTTKNIEAAADHIHREFSVVVEYADNSRRRFRTTTLVRYDLWTEAAHVVSHRTQSL